MLRPLIVVVLFFFVGSVCAFEISGRSWPQTVPSEPVTLTYSYSNLLTGGLLDASRQLVGQQQIRTAVEEAFFVWSQVAPLHFVEVADAGGGAFTQNYPAGQFGDIRLGQRHIDGSGMFKAVAYFPPLDGQSNCTLCGDVHFDNADHWELVGTLDLPDVLGAAIHEIGHALGLAHTDVAEANMYPVFRRHTGPGSGWLHPDDIAGIQAIYGAGSGSVTPLQPVAEPASCVPLAICGLSLVVHARLRHRLWLKRWHATSN